MTTTYRLLKAGKMVSTFRSTTRAPNGKDINLTQNKIGREGDEFSDLPDFQVEKIQKSIDEDEGVWEVIDAVEDDQEDAVSTDADVPPAPHGHEAEDGHSHETTFVGLDGKRLDELVELHALTVVGTGAQNKVLNGDKVKALQVEHGQG